MGRRHRGLALQLLIIVPFLALLFSADAVAQLDIVARQCEGRNLWLSCGAGRVLRVTGAVYGRFDDPWNCGRGSCWRYNSVTWAVTGCNGLTGCGVSVTNAAMGGDPCPRITNIRVTHNCECPPGTGWDGNWCSACRAGTRNAGGYWEECSQCPGGQISGSGATACTACASGLTANGQTQCACSQQAAPQIQNGAFRCGSGSTPSGGSCTAVCNTGFMGAPTITCGASGQWSAPSGACVPSVCSGALPQPPANALPWPSNCVNSLSGTVCSGSCSAGHLGRVNTTCLNTRTWSAPAGACVSQACLSNPCRSMANSNGTCFDVPPPRNGFSCGCADMFMWNGTACQATSACATRPCAPARLANSTGVCTPLPNIGLGYSCGCTQGFRFHNAAGTCVDVNSCLGSNLPPAPDGSAWAASCQGGVVNAGGFCSAVCPAGSNTSAPPRALCQAGGNWSRVSGACSAFTALTSCPNARPSPTGDFSYGQLVTITNICYNQPWFNDFDQPGKRTGTYDGSDASIQDPKKRPDMWFVMFNADNLGRRDVVRPGDRMFIYSFFAAKFCRPVCNAFHELDCDTDNPTPDNAVIYEVKQSRGVPAAQFRSVGCGTLLTVARYLVEPWWWTDEDADHRVQPLGQQASDTLPELFALKYGDKLCGSTGDRLTCTYKLDGWLDFKNPVVQFTATGPLDRNMWQNGYVWSLQTGASKNCGFHLGAIVGYTPVDCQYAAVEDTERWLIRPGPDMRLYLKSKYWTADRPWWCSVVPSRGNEVFCDHAKDDISTFELVPFCTKPRPALPNGYWPAPYDPYPEGHSASGACSLGYFGSPSVTCLASGEWGEVRGACKTCPKGYAYSADTRRCRLCPLGKHSAGSGAACQDCGPATRPTVERGQCRTYTPAPIVPPITSVVSSPAMCGAQGCAATITLGDAACPSPTCYWRVEYCLYSSSGRVCKEQLPSLASETTISFSSLQQGSFYAVSVTRVAQFTLHRLRDKEVEAAAPSTTFLWAGGTYPDTCTALGPAAAQPVSASSCAACSPHSVFTSLVNTTNSTDLVSLGNSGPPGRLAEPLGLLLLCMRIYSQQRQQQTAPGPSQAEEFFRRRPLAMQGPAIPVRGSNPNQVLDVFANIQTPYVAMEPVQDRVAVNVQPVSPARDGSLPQRPTERAILLPGWNVFDGGSQNSAAFADDRLYEPRLPVEEVDLGTGEEDTYWEPNPDYGVIPRDITTRLPNRRPANNEPRFALQASFGGCTLALGTDPTNGDVLATHLWPHDGSDPGRTCVRTRSLLQEHGRFVGVPRSSQADARNFWVFGPREGVRPASAGRPYDALPDDQFGYFLGANGVGQEGAVVFFVWTDNRGAEYGPEWQGSGGWDAVFQVTPGANGISGAAASLDDVGRVIASAVLPLSRAPPGGAGPNRHRRQRRLKE